MASSDVTHNIGCTEPALPLLEPVVERLAMPRNLLPPSPGDSQNAQVNPLDVALMDLPCGGASSGDPQSTLPTLDCSPCLAPDSALDIKPGAPSGISDDAELFVTCRVTYADHRSPPRPTTALSSSDASDKTDSLSVDSDAHFTPCEGLLCQNQNIRSQSYKAGTPSLSPTPGALLTPLSVDILAGDSSPSHPELSSDVFMHSTPPLSSPQIESNLTVIGGPTGARDADCASDHAKADEYPTITMSSPDFPLRGDEFPFSSSPPYPTTGTKRARYDDSDEVRCHKRTCGIYLKLYRSRPLQSP